jgi:hypothetical protein
MWVHTHLADDGGGAANFSAMPEVAGILEQKLDTHTEPTFAIRSVYGQYFPYLCHVDEEWTKRQLPKIFPREPSHKKYRNVAWRTYVSFNKPRIHVFQILRTEYERAVSKLSEDKGTKHDVADPDESLAEHLITFYWRGVLDFQDPEGLLAKFYRNADDDLRAHVIAYIGRSLKGLKEALPEGIKAKLSNLWQLRMREASQHVAPASYGKELAAFGSSQAASIPRGLWLRSKKCYGCAKVSSWSFCSPSL